MLSRSVMSNSVTPWTAAHWAPRSVGFFRQEYWSGLPFPPPEDLPNPGCASVAKATAAWKTPDPDAPAACGCHGARKGLAERSLMAHFLFHTFQIFFFLFKQSICLERWRLAGPGSATGSFATLGLRVCASKPPFHF